MLAEAGIAFLFAPAHHPALRHAALARRELGVADDLQRARSARKPRARDAPARRRLRRRPPPVAAQALAGSGTVRAWVVRGEDGLDEVSPCAPTRVSELDEGRGARANVAPEDFGVPRERSQRIAGGTAAENAEAIVRILEGEPHAARDAVVLNAAAALAIADATATLRACADRAREALASGAARSARAVARGCCEARWNERNGEGDMSRLERIARPRSARRSQP